MWRSHVAKYRSLMPSLALIGHLIDGVAGGPTGPVSGGAAARAVAWCAYLQGHARRLYASVTDQARVAAALLAARLTRGRLPSSPPTDRSQCSSVSSVQKRKPCSTSPRWCSSHKRRTTD